MGKVYLWLILMLAWVQVFNAQNLPPLATEHILQADRWKGVNLAFHPGQFESLEEALNHQFDSITALSPQKGFRATILFADSTSWRRVVGINSEIPLEPLSLDLAIGFGSTSKMFTATVIHQLVAENMLSYDDRIGDWLPPLNNIDSNITVRQLLNHTSGLSNYTENLLYLLTALSDFSHIWTPAEILSYQMLPWYEPGGGWYYSNTNYVLLSLIIEQATGNAFATELRNRILEPLGMTHTFSFPDELPAVPIAHIWYDLNGDGVVEDFQNTPNSSMNAIFSSLRGAAQLLGTTDNLAVFTRALASGQLLPEDQQQELLTFDSIATEQANGASYGLGITRRYLAGREMLGHNGYVFHQTRAYYFPEEGLTIIAQTNEGRQDTTITNLDDVFAVLALTSFKYLTPSVETPANDVQVRIMPNPAHDYFMVVSNGIESGIFRLFRAEGPLVRRASMMQEDALRIDCSDLEPGVYFWTWTDHNAYRRFSGKLLLNK